MIDIGADLQEAFDEGYEKGRADEHRWWPEHCAKCTDADRPSVDKEYLTKLIQEAVYDGEACARLLDLVDRPQGDVDAVDIFEREMHNLEQGYITIGEFDERIEPLRHLRYGRPQGEWIAKTENYHSHWVCSECGAWALLEYNEQMCLSNFCPNCGARMKGAEDDK